MGYFLRKIIHKSDTTARRPTIIGLHNGPIIGWRWARISDAFIVPALNAISDRIAGAVVSLRGRLRWGNNEIHLIDVRIKRGRRHESRINPTNQFLRNLIDKLII